MADYWSRQIHVALDDSRNAPSREIREVYLQIADHYRAMGRFCARPPHAANGIRIQI